MKLNYKITFLSILVSVLLILLLLFIYINVKIIGYKTYDIDYAVGDHIGINLDEDAIHFGTAREDMVLRRDITISSEVDISVKVKLIGLNYVHVEDTEFIVLAGEKRNIELLLKLPQGVEKGTYSGKLKLIYLKP
jgi:hypothetical protein